jgi:hypothetical protein
MLDRRNPELTSKNLDGHLTEHGSVKAVERGDLYNDADAMERGEHHEIAQRSPHSSSAARFDRTFTLSLVALMVTIILGTTLIALIAKNQATDVSPLDKSPVIWFELSYDTVHNFALLVVVFVVITYHRTRNIRLAKMKVIGGMIVLYPAIVVLSFVLADQRWLVWSHLVSRFGDIWVLLVILVYLYYVRKPLKL